MARKAKKPSLVEFGLSFFDGWVVALSGVLSIIAWIASRQPWYETVADAWLGTSLVLAVLFGAYRAWGKERSMIVSMEDESDADLKKHKFRIEVMNGAMHWGMANLDTVPLEFRQSIIGWRDSAGVQYAAMDFLRWRLEQLVESGIIRETWDPVLEWDAHEGVAEKPIVPL